MDVLQPGETCWRTAKADRAAFLIDTEAYFTAAFAAMQKARRSILLLGWGFDPRTHLFPDGYDGPEDPDEVGRILLQLADARPDLDIRLLIWKSALPISATRLPFAPALLMPYMGLCGLFCVSFSERAQITVPLVRSRVACEVFEIIPRRSALSMRGSWQPTRGFSSTPMNRLGG